VVHAADIQDYDGCEAVLDKARARFPRLKKIWADSRYACLETPRCVQLLYGWVLEVVRRSAGMVGFVCCTGGGWWSGRSGGSSASAG